MKRLNRKVLGLTGGMLTLGVGSAIGAGVASQLPAGSGVTPGQLTAPFNTAAGFMPVMTTAVMGGEALNIAANIGKKKRRR